MTIITSKTPPSNKVLKEILTQELSSSYNYKIFGLQADRSLLVSKSPLVGVQISKIGNEVTIQGTPPTVAAGILCFLLALLGMTYFTSEFKTLEIEVASFLTRKFV